MNEQPNQKQATDDTEGHVIRSGRLVEDDTEGHMYRSGRLVEDEDDTEGHARRR